MNNYTSCSYTTVYYNLWVYIINRRTICLLFFFRTGRDGRTRVEVGRGRTGEKR